MDSENRNMNKENIPRKFKWTEWHLEFLFEVWQKYSDQLRGTKKNSHVYLKMAAELEKRGVVITTKELRIKINNMSQKYRDEKKRLGTTGSSPSRWQFYEKIHKIVGGYPCNNLDNLDGCNAFDDAALTPPLGSSTSFDFFRCDMLFDLTTSPAKTATSAATTSTGTTCTATTSTPTTSTGSTSTVPPSSSTSAVTTSTAIIGQSSRKRKSGNQGDSQDSSSYHLHNHTNGHQDPSPNSSQISVHSDEALIRTHKQETTQKVTTVTKVVHEVKHFRPDGPLVDYVAMPLDVQHGSSDTQPVEYASLPVGIHSRSQYVTYNQLDQTPHQMAHQIYGSEASQYQQYQGYDHYVPGNTYANSPGPLNQPNTTVAGFISDYRANDRAGTAHSPNEHSGAPSPLPLSNVGQPHALVSTATFLPYDEMTDFRITPSPGIPVEHRYGDDPTTLIYGYVSTPTYGVAAELHNQVAANINPTSSYSTRPVIYDDNLNGSSFREIIATNLNESAHHASRMFDDENDLQVQMSQLSVQGREPTDSDHTSPRVGSKTLIDQNGENRLAMRWRDPNLSEVISFLNSPNNVIKANAAAYLQHLCYMDDPNKQRTRTLGGVPPLVRLLSHEASEVHRNACGALRNLSYGRQNDENKRAIKNAGGILALINLLRRSNESEIKELVTGVIWNMSSCEDLKRPIIDDGLIAIVTFVIRPHSGWDPINPGETCWSTVFRNASGVLRNVSSAGEYARSKLRECDGLIDSLLYVVRSAIEKSNIGNKIVENSVCILRNLSYRCQEVDDPNYDKYPLPNPARTSSTTSPKGENLGCFGGSRKKKESQVDQSDALSIGGNGTARSSMQRNEPIKGYELLWQPEVIQSYLSLLQSCSNPETLEAAAGAIQNLAACYWQPSIEIRAAVRKEKGLPILVELLRMEVDRVVCAVATALRNLAIDQRNKELIGKYAMRDLVQKLPSGNPQHDQGTSDDTIAAVLATINEVIKKNAEFSRSLLDAGGVERLMNITRQRQKYSTCVLKFASQVLFTMWQHQELRDVYKKQGWKEQDFVTKTVAARNAAPNSPSNANSTLNRPMASQGRTRYEDRTIKRNIGSNSELNSSRNTGNLSVSHSGSSSVCPRSGELPFSGEQPSYHESGTTTNARLYSSIVTGNGLNHST